MEGERLYSAFISYRHLDNREERRRWGEWLQRVLETYEIPHDLVGKTNLHRGATPSSLYPVFRDEVELAANADLPASIKDALTNSATLVVICSPRAVKSHYIAEEIKFFKELGRTALIFAVIIDGEPNADDPTKAARGIKPEDECFPERLRFGTPREDGSIDWTARTTPLAPDFRPRGEPVFGYTDAAAYRAALESEGKLPNAAAYRIAEKEYARRLAAARLQIISAVLGVPLGTLTKRDAEYRAQKFRKLATIFAALLLLALIAGAVAFWQRSLKEQQRMLAEQQRVRAEQERTLAVSRFLAARSIALGEKDLQVSAALAVQSSILIDGLDSRVALLAALHQSPVLLKFLQRRQAGTSHIAINADGTEVAIVDRTGRIRIHQVDTGELLLSIQAKDEGPVHFTADGRQLMRIDGKGEVQYWGIESGTLEKRLSLDLSGFDTTTETRVRLLADGAFAALEEEHEVRIFNCTSGLAAGPLLRMDENWLSTIHMRNDGGTLAITQDRKYLEINLSPVPHVSDLLSLSTGYYRGIGISPDFTKAFLDFRVPEEGVDNVRPMNFMAGRSTGVVFIDLQNRKPSGPMQPRHRRSVIAVDFSKDGKLLASGDAAGKLTVWNPQTQEYLGNLSGHATAITDIAFSENGTRLVSLDVSGAILIWDLTRRELIDLYDGKRHDELSSSNLGKVLNVDWGKRITSVQFARTDSRRLLVVYHSGKAATFDLANSVLKEMRAGDTSTPLSPTAAWTAQDEWQVTSAVSGEVTFWKGDEPGLDYSTHGVGHTIVAAHPNLPLVASAGGDRRIVIWRPQEGGWKSETLTQGEDFFTDLQFSPDGKFLAAATMKSISRWKIGEKLEPAEEFPIPDTRVASMDRSPVIAWSHRGDKIACGAPDGRVHILDATTGKPASPPSRTDELSVLALAFNADDTILAVGASNNGLITLLDVASLQQIGQLQALGNSVAALAFDPTGKVLISGDHGGHLMQWDVDIVSWRQRLTAMAQYQLTRTDWRNYLGSGLEYAPAFRSTMFKPKREATAPTLPAKSWPDLPAAQVLKVSFSPKTSENADVPAPKFKEPPAEATYAVRVVGRELHLSGTHAKEMVVAELGWDQSKEVLHYEVVDVSEDGTWATKLIVPKEVKPGVLLTAWASCLSAGGTWVYKPVHRFQVAADGTINSLPEASAP